MVILILLGFIIISVLLDWILNYSSYQKASRPVFNVKTKINIKEDLNPKSVQV